MDDKVNNEYLMKAIQIVLDKNRHRIHLLKDKDESGVLIKDLSKEIINTGLNQTKERLKGN